MISLLKIWNMFFGGRYLILMMGGFSVYAGLLYNDIFSLSVNIFSSKWRVPAGIYQFEGSPANWLDSAQLEPSPFHRTIYNNFTFTVDDASYLGSPYPFGLDPVGFLFVFAATFYIKFRFCARRTMFDFNKYKISLFYTYL